MHAGVLKCFTAAICPVAQYLLLKQQGWQPELIQRQQHGRQPELTQQQEKAFLDQLLQPFYTMRNLLCLWRDSVGAGPVLVPTAMRLMLPLVLQLRQCSALLASRTSEGSSTSCSRLVYELHELQSCASVLVPELFMVPQQLDVELDIELLSLLREPAVSDLLLQQLAVYTALLHQEYEEFQQQQQPPSGHSSSSSHVSSPLLKLQANLLHIPAFHLEVAELLPGGQAYLDAATAAAANQWGGVDRLRKGAWHACRLSFGLKA
jgi:hypothetical protein